MAEVLPSKEPSQRLFVGNLPLVIDASAASRLQGELLKQCHVHLKKSILSSLSLSLALVFFSLSLSPSSYPLTLLLSVRLDASERPSDRVDSPLFLHLFTSRQASIRLGYGEEWSPPVDHQVERGRWKRETVLRVTFSLLSLVQLLLLSFHISFESAPSKVRNALGNGAAALASGRVHCPARLILVCKCQRIPK